MWNFCKGCMTYSYKQKKQKSIDQKYISGYHQAINTCTCMITLNKIAVGNGFSHAGLYSQDQVHRPKYTLFNLQAHILLLQWHKVCKKNTSILMPAALYNTSQRNFAILLICDALSCCNGSLSRLVKIKILINMGLVHSNARSNLASQGLLLPHGATAKTLVPFGHVNS
jgi:hypothetical protein